ENYLRALERQHPRHLGKVAVETDHHADAPAFDVEHFERLARSEDLCLAKRALDSRLEKMRLVVAVQLSVRADDHDGVVGFFRIRRFLAHPYRDPNVQL